MKKGFIKLLIICLSLVVLAIINTIYPVINNYLYLFFLFIILIITIYLIGFENNKSIFEKDLNLISFFIPIFISVVTYMIGLFIGFISNGYSLILTNILKNILVFGSIIILRELIRYNIIKKGSKNKSIIFLTIITFILMELSFLIRGFNLSVGYELLKFIFLYIIPIMLNNILLTYITFRGGYKPSIIYSATITLPMYFMPIFPDLGIYMDIMFKTITFFATLFTIYIMTGENKQKNLSNIKVSKIGTTVVLLTAFSIIGVSSGWFKYQSLVIGSGSMEPAINIGDIIIIEKISQDRIFTIKVGETLVFWNDNNIIVHRVVDIIEENGRYSFYTRGDANDAVDTYVTKGADVLGIASFRIPILGYPTIWLSKMINK